MAGRAHSLVDYTSDERNALTPLFRFVLDLFVQLVSAVDKISTGMARRAVRPR